MLFTILVSSLFSGAMIYSALTDLFTMTIPNRISLALLAGFLLLAPFSGLDWQGFFLHIVAGLAMLAIGIAMFARGWIGGGDAKLFAVTALWFGFDHLLVYAVYSAFLGGLLTIALLLFRQVPLPAGMTDQAWVMRLYGPRQGIPYGIALAAAGLLVFPETLWMTGLA